MDFPSHKLQSVYTSIKTERANLFPHLINESAAKPDNADIPKIRSESVYSVNDVELSEAENQPSCETNESRILSSTYTEDPSHNQPNSVIPSKNLATNKEDEEDEIFRRILEKLYVAYLDLSPIIDEIINSAHVVAAPHLGQMLENVNCPVCSVTQEQFESAMKASKLVQEVNNEVILNAKHNMDLLKGDIIHFPVADLVVNTAHQILYTNFFNQGSKKHNRIFIEKHVVDQLIELYNLLHRALKELYQIAKEKQMTARGKLEMPNNLAHKLQEFDFTTHPEQAQKLAKLQEEYQGLSDTVNMLKSIIAETSGSVADVRKLEKSPYDARRSRSDNSVTDMDKSKKVTDISGARRCILECLVELAEVRKYLKNVDNAEEVDMINQIRLTGYPKKECCSRQDIPHLHAKLNGIPIVVKLQETLDTKIPSVENKINEDNNGTVGSNHKHTCVASTSTPIIKPSGQSTKMISADERELSSNGWQDYARSSTKSILSIRSSKSYSCVTETDRKPKNKTLSRRSRNNPTTLLMIRSRRSLTENTSSNQGDFLKTYFSGKTFLSDKTISKQSSTSISEKIFEKLKTAAIPYKPNCLKKKSSPSGKSSKFKSGYYTLKYSRSGKLLEMSCHMKRDCIGFSEKEAIVIRLESLANVSIKATQRVLESLNSSSMEKVDEEEEEKMEETVNTNINLLESPNNSSTEKVEEEEEQKMEETVTTNVNLSDSDHKKVKTVMTSEDCAIKEDSDETLVDSELSKAIPEDSNSNKSFHSCDDSESAGTTMQKNSLTVKRSSVDTSEFNSSTTSANVVKRKQSYHDLSQKHVEFIFDRNKRVAESTDLWTKARNLEAFTLLSKGFTRLVENQTRSPSASTFSRLNNRECRSNIYTQDLAPITDVEEELSETDSDLTMKSSNLDAVFVKDKQNIEPNTKKISDFNTTTKPLISNNETSFTSSVGKSKSVPRKAEEANVSAKYIPDKSSSESSTVKPNLVTFAKYKNKTESKNKDKRMVLEPTQAFLSFIERKVAPPTKILYKHKDYKSKTISAKTSVTNLNNPVKIKLLIKRRDRSDKSGGDCKSITSSKKHSCDSISITETDSNPNIPYAVSIRSIPHLHKDNMQVDSKLRKRNTKKRSHQTCNENTLTTCSSSGSSNSYSNGKSYNNSLPYPVSLMSLPKEDIDVDKAIENNKNSSADAKYKSYYSKLDYYSNLETNFKGAKKGTYEVRYFELKNYDPKNQPFLNPKRDDKNSNGNNSHTTSQQMYYPSVDGIATQLPSNLTEYSNLSRPWNPQTFEVRVFEFARRSSKNTSDSEMPTLPNQLQGIDDPPQAKSRYYNYPDEEDFAVPGSAPVGGLFGRRNTSERRRSSIIPHGHGPNRLSIQPWAPFVASDISLPQASIRDRYPGEEDLLSEDSRKKVKSESKSVETDKVKEDRASDPISRIFLNDAGRIKRAEDPFPTLRNMNFVPSDVSAYETSQTPIRTFQVTSTSTAGVDFQLPQKGPRALVDASTSYHDRICASSKMCGYPSSTKAAAGLSQKSSRCTCDSKDTLSSVSRRQPSPERSEVARKLLYFKSKANMMHKLRSLSKCENSNEACICGKQQSSCKTTCKKDSVNLTSLHANQRYRPGTSAGIFASPASYNPNRRKNPAPSLKSADQRWRNQPQKGAGCGFNPQIMYYISDELSNPFGISDKDEKNINVLQEDSLPDTSKLARSSTNVQNNSAPPAAIPKLNVQSDNVTINKAQGTQYCLTLQDVMNDSPSVQNFASCIVDNAPDKMTDGEQTYNFCKTLGDSYYFLCIPNELSSSSNENIGDNNGNSASVSRTVSDGGKVTQNVRKHIHHNTLLNFHANLQQNFIIDQNTLYQTDGKFASNTETPCMSQESLDTNKRSSTSTIELPKINNDSTVYKLQMPTRLFTDKYLANKQRKERESSSTSTLNDTFTLSKSHNEFRIKSQCSLFSLPQKETQTEICKFGTEKKITQQMQSLKCCYTVGTNTDFLTDDYVVTAPSTSSLPHLNRSEWKFISNESSNEHFLKCWNSVDSTKAEENTNKSTSYPITSSSTITVINTQNNEEALVKTPDSKSDMEIAYQYHNCPYVYEVFTKQDNHKSNTFMNKLGCVISGMVNKKNKKKSVDVSKVVVTKGSSRIEKVKPRKMRTKLCQTPDRYTNKHSQAHIIGSTVEMDSELKTMDTYRIIISHLTDACTQSAALKASRGRAVNIPIENEKSLEVKNADIDLGSNDYNTSHHFHYDGEVIPTSINKCTQSPPVTYRSKLNNSEKSSLPIFQWPEYISASIPKSQSESSNQQESKNERQRLDNLFTKREKKYVTWNTLSKHKKEKNHQNCFHSYDAIDCKKMPSGIDLVINDAFRAILKVKSTTSSAKSSSSDYNDSDTNEHHNNKNAFDSKSSLPAPLTAKNQDCNNTNSYWIPPKVEENEFLVYLPSDKKSYKRVPLQHTDDDYITDEQILSVRKKEIGFICCTNANVCAEIDLKQNLMDSGKQAQELSPLKPIKLTSSQSLRAVPPALNLYTQQTVSDNRLNINCNNQSCVYPVTVPESLLTQKPACTTERQCPCQQEDCHCCGGHKPHPVSCKGVKDCSTFHCKTDCHKDNCTCSYSQQLVAHKLHKEVETYQNNRVSKPQQDKICWALTRVKTNADGTRDFEILETSPVPAGHFLIPTANSVILLGNQPYVYSKVKK